jgi:hypothetical protein
MNSLRSHVALDICSLVAQTQHARELVIERILREDRRALRSISVMM